MTTAAYYSPPLSQIAGGAQPVLYAVFQIGSVIYAQAAAGTGLQTYVETDAATAINNAITAVNAAGGGAILVRTGTYTLTSPIVFNGVNNISLVGEDINSVIFQNSLTTFSSSIYSPSVWWDLIDLAASKATTNITLSNFTLSLNANSTHYVSVINCNYNGNTNYTIDQINMTNLVVKLTGADASGVEGIWSQGDYTSSGGPSFTKTGSYSRINITDCIITSSASSGSVSGIYASYSTQRIQRCYLSGWGSGANAALLLDIGDFWADECVVTSSGDGIDANDSTTYAVITDCIVTACTNIGMQISNIFTLVIGCTVKWCTGSGINLAPSVGGYALAQGCVIRNNNQGGSATGSGIIVNGAQSKVASCDLSDDQGTHTQAYGLYYTTIGGDTANDVVVTGCNFSGNKTGAIGSSSGLVNLTARDCQGWNPIGSVTPPANPLVSGTVYHNTSGSDFDIYIPITYNPTVGNAATAQGAIGPTNAVATSLTTDSEPAGFTQGLIRSYRIHVPSSWYYSITVTNATIGSSVIVGN